MHFFYDSLDTLKKVSTPTVTEFITLTIAIFVIVIIAGAYFAGVDAIFVTLFKILHGLLRGSADVDSIDVQ